MFKKPRKNYRRRGRTGGDDEEAEENGSGAANEILDTPSAVATDSLPLPSLQLIKDKIKKEKGRKVADFKKKINSSTTGLLGSSGSGSTLLSFEEEGDVDIFQVKKPSRSQKIAKKLKSESRKEKELEEKKKVHEEKRMKVEKEDQRNQNDEKLLEERFSENGDDSEGSNSSSDVEHSRSHTFKSVLERGEIPDATMIHLARKQRQMARETGFIPLEEPKPEPEKSRLIREDDNDLSDDENERISFATNAYDRERQAMRDQFLAAEHGSDEDSDHLNEWELQQIRKGVSVPAQLQSEEQEQSSISLYDQYVSHQSLYNQAAYPMEIESTASVAPSLPTEMKEITVEQVKNTLKERLNISHQVHRTHIAEKEKIDNDLKSNEDDIETFENKVILLEEKYKFFQEMRGFVRDLVECLNEKYPRISNLEEKIINSLKQQAQKLVGRRQQDVRDQSAEYNPNQVNQVLVPDEARQRRAAEREARRARRRRAREGKSNSSHKEGLSSDDEEHQSEITKFQLERVQIHNECCGLFEDVVEDFYKIKRIKNRFQQWKYQYIDIYKEAYIGLCLPKLFTPLIRLQLIEWNPLLTKSVQFEKLPWFQSLMFYGFREGVEMVDNDDDWKLAPSILDKVLIPRLTVFVQNVWDPMSSSQTKSLSSIVKRLLAEYPLSTDSKNVKALVKAVVDRMKKTLDDDVFMPLYPKTVVANVNSPASAFFNRQLWSCLKLFSNILSWSELLNDGLLKELAIDALLNRYILLGLMNSPMNQDGLQKCQMVLSSLPKHWFSDLEGDSTFPPIENFCRFLSNCAKNLDEAAKTGKEYQKKESREMVKQISKLLVNLHAMDHALQLSNQFSFKIPV